MKNNKPIRMCVYTRKKAYKDEMIRLVKNNENRYCIDENMKAQSRGIYIYPCIEVLKHIEKNKKYDIVEEAKEKIITQIKVGDGVE